MNLLPKLSTIPKLSILLVCLPAAIVMKIVGVDGLPMFLVSGIGILGAVTLIGKATEEIAIYAGPLWGGLMNATFGNVTELIIALFALRAGEHEIVRASIIGSVLGNLLLILGGAMLYGGLRHQTQRFSRTGAHVNVGMLWVCLIMLVVPSMVSIAYQFDADLTRDTADTMVRHTSLAAAVMLLVIYVLGLIFSLMTHRFLLMPDTQHHEQAEWSKGFGIVILLAATLIVAFLSEAFVHSIQHLGENGAMPMSKLFIGVIVVAVVGNAAEGMVAIWVARDDKMELSFQIAMGSCLQVALMVAPVLVIASYFMGGMQMENMMALNFHPFEIMSLGAAILIASSALSDGESNWLEGTTLLAVYLFFAIVFWFHP